MIDYLSGEVLQDQTRVQWRVRMLEKENLVSVREVELDFHICTQDDFDQFYPVVEENHSFLQTLKEQKALYCINADQELKLRGESTVSCNALYIDYKQCVSSESNKCAN